MTIPPASKKRLAKSTNIPKVGYHKALFTLSMYLIIYNSSACERNWKHPDLSLE